MAIEDMTLVPAGAGSGKTYTIKQKLAKWIADGEVRPDRIIAVTFTEAAAGELKERIRSELLEAGEIERALELDNAFISTIHGFGLRLLMEYCFEAGISPVPRLLSNEEQDALIRKALSAAPTGESISRRLLDFGYAFDPASGKGAEVLFRDRLREMMDRLRFLGSARRADPSVAEQAARWVSTRYGETDDGETLTRALRDSVKGLLDAFPDSLEEMGGSATAQKALAKDYRNLRRAASEEALDKDWKLWVSLQSLKRSDRNTTLPAEYDAMAVQIEEAAKALSRHPGPRGMAAEHAGLLVRSAQEALEDYAASMEAAGLIDYTDMISLTLDLVSSDEELRKALVKRFDCLIIDEFQDTNPLQFLLLWKLASLGLRTLIVGDTKQAIMGFQGADPRLMDEMVRTGGDRVSPLTGNWRTQPRLMRFINGVAGNLLEDGYAALEPHAADSGMAPLEVLLHSVRPPKGVSEAHALARGAADRVRDLLASGETVTDRQTGARRPIRGNDIAILCPRHRDLAVYAAALRDAGIRAQVPRPDWLETPVIQIMDQAMAYVADASDRHAALYLAVTEMGNHSLQEALGELNAGRPLNAPVLEALDAVRNGTPARSVEGLVSDIIRALDFYRKIMRWPHGEQARANLLRLQGEAQEFCRQPGEGLAAAGYHGHDLQTFRGWLRLRALGQSGDNHQPYARAIDETAVELSTWHSAKGREWPVVMVCGVKNQVQSRVPEISIDYESFSDMERILDGARVEFSPKLNDPNSRSRFEQPLQERAEREAIRLLYVALTRAREKLVLEWPAYKSGHKTVSFWSLLRERGQLSLNAELEDIGDVVEGSMSVAGDGEYPAKVIGVAGGEDRESAPPRYPLKPFGLRAVKRADAAGPLTPDSVTPSAQESESLVSKGAKVYDYARPMPKPEGVNLNAWGIFAHAVLAGYGFEASAASHLPGEDVSALRDGVMGACAAFSEWLSQTLAPSEVVSELPLLALDDNGSVLNGVTDLVARTSRGAWILDHKTGTPVNCLRDFARHAAQLGKYRDALERAGYKVRGVGVHWPHLGKVCLQEVAD